MRNILKSRSCCDNGHSLRSSRSEGFHPASFTPVPVYESRGPVCNEDENVPIIKPIRIFQFILASTLLGLTIYTISNEPPYPEFLRILLVLIFGAFTFIALIDIISQLGGDPISDTPMFLFGVFGAVTFLLAAIQIFNVTRRNEVKDPWRVTVTMVISLLASILYLTDILLIFLYGY